MTKDELELYTNILRIAEAKGTPNETKLNMSREKIDELLFEGSIKVKAIMIMKEAMTAVIMTHDLMDETMGVFKKLCVVYGESIDAAENVR